VKIFLCILGLIGSNDWHTHPPIEGATVQRTEKDGAITRVYLEEHAFTPKEVDRDGRWLWLCTPVGCLTQVVPLEVRDHSRGLDVDVEGDVAGVQLNGRTVQFDVVFKRVKILGTGPRATEWRARIEALRGHHSLTQP
jgi:hypothetical protein